MAARHVMTNELTSWHKEMRSGDILALSIGAKIEKESQIDESRSLIRIASAYPLLLNNFWLEIKVGDMPSSPPSTDLDPVQITRVN